MAGQNIVEGGVLSIVRNEAREVGPGTDGIDGHARQVAQGREQGRKGRAAQSRAAWSRGLPAGVWERGNV